MVDTPIFDSIEWAFQNRFLFVGWLPQDHEEYVRFEQPHFHVSGDSGIEDYVIPVVSEEFANALAAEFRSLGWETYCYHHEGVF